MSTWRESARSNLYAFMGSSGVLIEWMVVAYVFPLMSAIICPKPRSAALYLMYIGPVYKRAHRASVSLTSVSPTASAASALMASSASRLLSWRKR